jgi:hypothetical protein
VTASLAVRHLFAQHNRLRSLGDSLAPLAGLQTLVLNDNHIESLGSSLMSLRRLQTLNIARNALATVEPAKELPPSLRHLIMVGNPWSLTCVTYRRDLIEALPSLESLDGLSLSTGEEVLLSVSLGEEAASIVEELSHLDEDLEVPEDSDELTAAFVSTLQRRVEILRRDGGAPEDRRSTRERLAREMEATEAFVSSEIDRPVEHVEVPSRVGSILARSRERTEKARMEHEARLSAMRKETE